MAVIHSIHIRCCFAVLHRIAIGCSLLVLAMPAGAQSGSSHAPDTQAQLSELRSQLSNTRAELSHAQNQIEVLAEQIEALRQQLTARTAPGTAPLQHGPEYPSAADVARGQKLGQETAAPSSDTDQLSEKLLAARIEEQHQTKVESASKYRVKISGLVLMNAFTNRGTADVADIPKVALNSHGGGSVGASIRQSVLGLQVFGPELAGAATSASVAVDFAGGFPQAPYGNNLGILRLREGSAHFDWQNTSLVVGQETLFMAPLSPTSYATLAEPALSYSGNLWAWTPQVALEHRFRTSDDTYFSATGGLLAPPAESRPDYPYSSPFSGERSRRPAFGSDFSYQSKVFGHPLAVGIGGYFGHLRFSNGRDTDSWAITSHWRFPFGSAFELSGEAYRGLAVGGLGGGIWQSVAYNGDPVLLTTAFRPLNAAGGWSQLKFRPHSKWELNGAIGQDNVFAKDLRWAPSLTGEYMPLLSRNRAAFGNFIFRPKSNLLFSVEYRKIWSFSYAGQRNTADQVNIGAGVSF